MTKNIATVILVLTFISFFYVIFLLIWPYKIVTIKKLPYPIKNQNIAAGEYVVLDTDYCKYQALPASYFVQFIATPSGQVTTLEEKYLSNLDTGCKHVDFRILTPETVAPGKYIIRLNIRYQVNPIRTVDYSFDSEPFDIIGIRTTSQKLDLIINTLSDWELDETDIGK